MATVTTPNPGARPSLQPPHCPSPEDLGCNHVLVLHILDILGPPARLSDQDGAGRSSRSSVRQRRTSADRAGTSRPSSQLRARAPRLCLSTDGCRQGTRRMDTTRIASGAHYACRTLHRFLDQKSARYVKVTRSLLQGLSCAGKMAVRQTRNMDHQDLEFRA